MRGPPPPPPDFFFPPIRRNAAPPPRRIMGSADFAMVVYLFSWVFGMRIIG
jgi:hypothetical protein